MNPYKSTNITFREDIVHIEIIADMLHLPYSFNLLDVQPSKLSSGKFWNFHMNLKGVLKGYLSPSGYILYGEETRTPNHGEFFL